MIILFLSISQRLEPVWEAFAEKVEAENLPVSIVKVDCVANQNLCMQQRIQAFPALRLFKDSVAQPPDYRMDRTLDAMMEFVKQRLATDEQVCICIYINTCIHIYIYLYICIYIYIYICIYIYI
jgi:hypothetical protein